MLLAFLAAWLLRPGKEGRQWLSTGTKRQQGSGTSKASAAAIGVGAIHTEIKAGEKNTVEALGAQSIPLVPLGGGRENAAVSTDPATNTAANSSHAIVMHASSTSALPLVRRSLQWKDVYYFVSADAGASKQATVAGADASDSSSSSSSGSCRSNEKQLLSSVSGFCAAGTLTALSQHHTKHMLNRILGRAKGSLAHV